MTIQELTSKRDAGLKEMKDLIDRAKRDGRDLTTGEVARFDELEAEAAELVERMKNGPLQSRIGYGAVGNTGATADADSIGADLWRAMRESGFNTRANPSVKFEMRTFMPPQTTMPLGTGSLPRGNYLWPALRRVQLDSLTIGDFQAGARSTSGTIERSPLAATDKAILSAPISYVSATARQIAFVVENVPQAVLDFEPASQAFFENEASLYISQSLDTHCVAMITAAVPPHGTVGSDTVVKVRNAQSAMRALGQSPDIVVLNSADAVALDLLADASGYLADPRSNTTSLPLWGLQVIERAVGSDVPLLLDSRRLGVLYLARVAVTADIYSGLKQNTVDVRFEIECYLHVRDTQAAYRVSAT